MNTEQALQDIEKEQLLFKQQNAVKIEDKISNSLIPSIQESERFVKYLNNRFSLGLPDNIVVTIEGIKPSVMGYFMPINKAKGYTNTTQDLNTITLSSIWLKKDAYNTIAHEVAHFYNNSKGVKDCSSNQYHNKEFKIVAERLLLSVVKTKHGYSQTDNTQEFLKMIEDFKPSENAFHISQYFQNKDKKPSRNLLFMCSCGVKIRTAKNSDKPFIAVCGYCNTEFKQKGGEDE